MKRRSILMSVLAGPFAGCMGLPHADGVKPTLVLVHGAWHGAWCWDRVVPVLSSQGYQVTAVTLPGMGERKAELSTAIDLESHISAVVEAVAKITGPVTLVGHSYGGFVVTGAADRLAPTGRLRSLVYVDAFVPGSGERVADYMPAAARTAMETAFSKGDAAYKPVPARFFGISDPTDITWVEARLTAHPAGTYLQPLSLKGALPENVKLGYIACENPKLSVFDTTKSRAKASNKWRYTELQTGHDAMVTAPANLAASIIRLI